MRVARVHVAGRGVAFAAVAGLGLALVQPVAPAAAASQLWVDASSSACSNSGPGTADKPFCTITAAARQATSPGDVVTVRPGTYREQVTVAGSGASGAPITFIADGGGVVLRGTRDLSDAAGWTAAAGSAWSRAFAPPSSPKQVFVDDRRLAAVSAVDEMRPSSYFYDSAARVLYVDIGGGNPADGHTVEAGGLSYGFSISGRTDVVVDGFAMVGQNKAGARVATSSGVTLRGLTVADSAMNGILVQSSTGPVSIAQSTVSGSMSVGIQLTHSSGVLIERSSSRDNQRHGIGLSASSGNTVRYSLAFGNDAGAGATTASGIDVNNASTGNVLLGNTLHHNQDSGIQVYSGSHQALVVRNVSYANGDHGFDTLRSTDAKYVNNTAFGNRSDGFSVKADSVNVVLSNNIVVDNGVDTGHYNVFVDSTSVVGLRADHDLVWSSRPVPPLKVGGVVYRSVVAFAAASGQELHGSGVDPIFTDAAEGKLSLRQHSPALDSADSAAPGFQRADRDGTLPVDDISVPDTGAGPEPFADRGALERTPTPGGPFDYPPHAVLVLDRTAGKVPPAFAVVADASGSSDADFSPITSYTFDFGDGSVVGPQPEAVANHAYLKAGSYQVTVTVRDSSGASEFATRAVTVTDRPPSTFAVAAADAACDDSGPGSAATPYCTLKAAAAVSFAGDTVVVRPAVYREQVTLRQGGEPGHPLVWRASGPGVQVLGTDDVSGPAAWSGTATTAWSRPFTPSTAPTQVFVDGARLTRATSATTTVSGTYFFDPAAQLLYVDLGGTNPGSGHAIEAGSRSYGFRLWSLSNVVIDGFEIRNQNGAAVSLRDAADVALTGLETAFAGSYGVQADRVTGQSVIDAVDAHDNASIGIRLYGSTGMTLRGSSAHDNGFHGISLQGSPDNVVSGNTAFRNARPNVRAAAGIDVSAGSTGVVVERNTTYANQDSGIEIYTGADQAIVRRNLIYDNGDHGIDCFDSVNNAFVGNTVYKSSTSGINLEGGCSDSVVSDNISADNGLVSSRTVGNVRVDELSSPGTTIDRNLVYASVPGVLYEWNSVAYSSQAAFRNATGQEAAGLEADPGWIDPGARNLRLGAGSPAIDTADATANGWAAADHDGALPVDEPNVPNTGTGSPPYADLGAFEYVGVAGP